MIKEIFIQEKRPHESGAKHVSGYANYTDDISEPEGTLYGAIGWAKKSHAIIKKIDLKNVIKSEGVVAVVTSKDIPGRNDVGKRLNISVNHYLLSRPNRQSLREKPY